MTREPRVAWSKGIFLVPQLFQAQERFFESQLDFRVRLGRFEPWGIEKVAINPGSLANRTFNLLECTGVLPDGHGFSLPDWAPLPAGRDFHGNFPANQNTLEVFLVLPERSPGERNISFPGGPSLRFTALDEVVTDESDGQEETISVARPNFRILFAGEQSNGLTVLPIARIQRSGGGAYELDQEYIPPCVNAACAPHLWDEVLKSLLDRMVFLSYQLNRDRSDRSELLATFDDSDIQRFWVLHLVNRAIPEFQHILAIRHAHPEEMYRFLLRLAGALCTFSTEYLITDFPAYDHRNLSACLIPVASQVRRMLETMTFRKRRCLSIAFEKVDSPRRLKAVLTPQLVKECREKAELYLAFREDPGGRARNPDEFVKVLGPDTMARAETLAGLELMPVSQAPADCARRERGVYFQIVQPRVSSKTVSRLTSSGVQGRTQGRGEPDADLLPWRFEVWEDILAKKEVRLYFIDAGAAVTAELLAVVPQAR